MSFHRSLARILNLAQSMRYIESDRSRSTNKQKQTASQIGFHPEAGLIAAWPDAGRSKLNLNVMIDRANAAATKSCLSPQVIVSSRALVPRVNHFTRECHHHLHRNGTHASRSQGEMPISCPRWIGPVTRFQALLHGVGRRCRQLVQDLARRCQLYVKEVVMMLLPSSFFLLFSGSCGIIIAGLRRCLEVVHI